VSAWHSAMDPGNPTQRAHAYALLRCILGQAKEEGLLAGDNPCRIRGAGVFRREREIEPLSIPQLEVIGRPKSDAGVRKVAVPPHVVPALRAHLDSHVAHSLTRCFATLSGAHWTHGNFCKAAWIRHGRRPASPPSASTICGTPQPCWPLRRGQRLASSWLVWGTAPLWRRFATSTLPKGAMLPSLRLSPAWRRTSSPR
jgi:hypothetical protein